MIETAINIILFIMLVVTALAIIRMDKLFAVVMLSGVFSFLSALLFIVMDAVDVAFTEAAVGAGITTVLMLGTIALTARTQKKITKIPINACIDNNYYWCCIDLRYNGYAKFWRLKQCSKYACSSLLC